MISGRGMITKKESDENETKEKKTNKQTNKQTNQQTNTDNSPGIIGQDTMTI
jgi:hypothetical protein